MKNKKLIPFFVWAIKRKDSDEIYLLNDFFWTESDVERVFNESRDGGYKYAPKESFEIIKIKITQYKKRSNQNTLNKNNKNGQKY